MSESNCGFTLANAADAGRYTPGMAMVFKSRPRWWVRLWRWLTRYDRRHPPGFSR